MEAEERPAKIRKLSHGGKDVTVLSASTDKAVVSTTDSTADDLPVEDIKEDVSKDSVMIPTPNDSSSDNGVSENDKVVAHAPSQDNITAQDPPLSKNQQKKLKKKLEWEAGRDERKALRKEKLIAKRERRKLAAKTEPEPAEQKEFIPRKQLPITIIIDCDFDEFMHDGERTSLASQVTRSYSDNKNALFRAHLTISSFGGHLRKRFEGILAGMYKKWRGTRFLEADFVAAAEQAKVWMSAPGGGVLEGAFSKYNKDHHQSIERLQELGEVVYLSAEADDTLEELKPFSTYIIGGIVDKNREKGLCHRRATERGMKTARLPIGEYLQMSSRKVLTTNHVNEIMLKWLETSDWGEAFMQVIPKRKGGQLKDDDNQDDDETDAIDQQDDIAACEAQKQE